jgi:tetratricopeptide (TPR) repeat protein
MKRAERLYRQGQIFLSKGDQERAIKKFEESISLSEMIGFKTGIANNLNELAIVHTQNKAFDKARELLSQSLAIYKELNMESEVSKTLNNLALSYEQEGDFEKAISTYEELFDWDKKTDNYIGMGLTVSHIGYIFKRHLGDQDKARSKFIESIPYFQKAIDAYWKTGTRSGMAKALYNLGFVHERYLGDREQALSKYEEALSLAKETGPKELAAKILDDIAEIRGSRREFGKAKEALSESAQFYKELGMLKQASKSLKNAALACIMKRDYQAAIVQYEELMSWHREIDDDLGVAVALNNLGLIYKNHLNQPDEAQKHFAEALKILKDIGNERYIQIVEKNISKD